MSVKYPTLQFSSLGLASETGPASTSINIPNVKPYSFELEVQANTILQTLQADQEAKAEKKRKWLADRAVKRRENEIKALQLIEEEHKRQQDEALLAVEQAKEEARLAAEREREEAARLEMKQANAWQNAQLDITGQLLTQPQIDAVRNFQAVCGITDDYKSIQLVVLAKWDANAAINTLFACGNIDGAISRLEPSQAPQTLIDIIMPNQQVIQKTFAGDDSLWVLQMAVQELMQQSYPGNPRFSLTSVDTSYCYSYPDSNLNKSFSQSGLFPAGRVIVQQRHSA